MEQKKRTTIGFWGKETSNGKFYSSIVITPEIIALLQQAEVGGQLTINPNTFEDRGPNSPELKLAFVPKAKVQARVSAYKKKEPTRGQLVDADI